MLAAAYPGTENARSYVIPILGLNMVQTRSDRICCYEGATRADRLRVPEAGTADADRGRADGRKGVGLGRSIVKLDKP